MTREERLQRYRQAVVFLAHRRARKAVEAELRSKGIRVTLTSPATINALARDYFAKHREELIAFLAFT
jgi:hypothetical protein